MAITGGSVSFEQSRKLAEYENRKASVTFNVTQDEGHEKAVAEVLAALELAEHHVLVALGLKKQTEFQPAAAEPEKSTKGTRKRPPAVDVKVDPPKPAEDPAAVVDETPTKPAGAAASETPATSSADVVDDSLFTASTPEVTDAELLSQITRKNAALQIAIGDQAPPKIRALIGKYVTAPKQAKDIPQEQRAKFLEDLAALNA